MSTTEPVADNGVNVEALLDARTALTDAPEAAEFTWRATTEWVRGTHSADHDRGATPASASDHSHKSTFSYTGRPPGGLRRPRTTARPRSSSSSSGLRPA